MQIGNPYFRELRYNKPAHPVCGCGSSSAASAPGEGVDLGVVNPGHFCEAGAIEKVVEEEHGGSDTAELGELVFLFLSSGRCEGTNDLLARRVTFRIFKTDRCNQVARTHGQRTVQHHPSFIVSSYGLQNSEREERTSSFQTDR